MSFQILLPPCSLCLQSHPIFWQRGQNGIEKEMLLDPVLWSLGISYLPIQCCSPELMSASMQAREEY